MVTSNKAGRILDDEILGRWVRSGYIRSHAYVKDSAFSQASTLRLTLSGHQEGDSSIFLQIVSGLTLLVIPYYVDSKMQLTYTLEDATTGCRFAASVSDSYNTVVGLLLLPATPFSQRGRTRTLDRIADNLYQQLASQGAFEGRTPCNPESAPLSGSRPARDGDDPGA